MPVLHNRISNETLKAQMLAESEPRTTISFYKYFTIVDPKATRDALWIALTKLNVFGRIYLAHEGINAQISVPESQVDALREFLYAFDPALDGLRMNIALDDDGKSFWVLRLKVRDRIVADGIDDPTFDASDVGDYLKAAEVNAMLADGLVDAFLIQTLSAAGIIVNVFTVNDAHRIAQLAAWGVTGIFTDFPDLNHPGR